MSVPAPSSALPREKCTSPLQLALDKAQGRLQEAVAVTEALEAEAQEVAQVRGRGDVMGGAKGGYKGGAGRAGGCVCVMGGMCGPTNRVRGGHRGREGGAASSPCQLLGSHARLGCHVMGWPLC